jgi:hypothetical protein
MVDAFCTAALAAERADALTAEPSAPADVVLDDDAADDEPELADELQAASARRAAAAPAPANVLDFT